MAVFDVVTSRAVAPMDRLARWSLPLVRPGGLFLAMKGSSAAGRARAGAARLHPPPRRRRRARCVDRRVSEWLSPPVTVVSVTGTR